MHYIRLLRPPKLAGTAKQPYVELVFTITTDLGDSFLWPEEPIDLLISFEDENSSSLIGRRPQSSSLSWEPGMRIAKPKIAVPATTQAALRAGRKVELCITAGANHAARGTREILKASEIGQIMPIWAHLNQQDEDVDVSTRKLALTPSGALEHSDSVCLEVEEEIGESIARHIWDAGVIALCAIGNLPVPPEPEATPTGQTIEMAHLRDLVCKDGQLNVLELGCGVGILGIGFAATCATRNASPRNILLTDLAEAENRARSNIQRWERTRTEPERQAVQLEYENLDWEDGRQGRFGQQVQSRRWDVIMLSDCTYNVDMLPALVETLSALHVSNASHGLGPSKVFLATKPRHESERALFELMSTHGWVILEEQILPLPVLGAEAESVEFYLFQKS